MTQVYRCSVVTFQGINKKLLLASLGSFREFNARFPGFNLRSLKNEHIPGLEGYRSYNTVSPQLDEAINLLIENWLNNTEEKVDFIVFGEVAGNRQTWRLAWIIRTEGNGIKDEFVNKFRLSQFTAEQLPDWMVLRHLPEESWEHF